MKTLNDTINGVMESGPARRRALMDWVLARLIHDEISGVLVELAAFLQDGGLTAEQLGKLDTIGAQLHEVKSFTTKLIITASRSEAAITSARMGENKRGKTAQGITKEGLKEIIAAWRGGWVIRGSPPPDEGELPRGLKTYIHRKTGSTYRHVIKHYLPEWDMTEDKIMGYMTTGEW